MFGIRRHILKSSPLALIPLLLLSGAAIMLFFCLLAGVRDQSPLNRVFFLQADTSNIPGAPSLSHFTLHNVCDQHNGVNFACRARRAASPMLPQQFFGTSTGVPEPFLRHPDRYFYLSRFAYAFYIITLFWVLLALLLNIVALLSTRATLAAAIVSGIALISCAFLAAIMTAAYVLAQNAFRSSGRFARVGVKAFAFTWTPLALIFGALLTLSALWYYRHRRDKLAMRATEKPRHGRGSMMSGLMSRHNRKHRRSHDYGKRASYDSSFYNEDIHQEKDIDRGVAPAQNTYTDTYGNSQANPHGDSYGNSYGNSYTNSYANRPTTAVGRDERGGRGLSSNDYTEERGIRRFTGHIGDDYTTPGARGGSSSGYVAYSPGARTGAQSIATATSPVQLNAARYPTSGVGTIQRGDVEQPVVNSAMETATRQ